MNKHRERCSLLAAENEWTQIKTFAGWFRRKNSHSYMQLFSAANLKLIWKRGIPVDFFHSHVRRQTVFCSIVIRDWCVWCTTNEWAWRGIECRALNIMNENMIWVDKRRAQPTKIINRRWIRCSMYAVNSKRHPYMHKSMKNCSEKTNHQKMWVAENWIMDRRALRFFHAQLTTICRYFMLLLFFHNYFATIE